MPCDFGIYHGDKIVFLTRSNYRMSKKLYSPIEFLDWYCNERKDIDKECNDCIFFNKDKVDPVWLDIDEICDREEYGFKETESFLRLYFHLKRNENKDWQAFILVNMTDSKDEEHKKFMVETLEEYYYD